MFPFVNLTTLSQVAEFKFCVYFRTVGFATTAAAENGQCD